jgi:hypothetical protein
MILPYDANPKPDGIFGKDKALIAARSGWAPMMFKTRVRL